MSRRSVLLASNCNVWREAFNSQSEGFLSVVAGLEDADVVAPDGAKYLSGHAVRPTVPYLLSEFAHRLASHGRVRLGLSGLSNMVEREIDRNYDLFFFPCQFPHEITAVNRLRGWRKRTGLAVAYVMETWSSSLAHAKSNLRLLDDFDHVFVLNTQSIPELRKYTSAPISGLVPATDCLLATPLPLPPRRSIDVFSFGRRSAKVHTELLEMAERSQDFFYVYDSMTAGKVKNWRDHRFLIASQMKRALFFIAFNPGDVGAGAKGAFRKEQAISTRYFEGAAGGAVMLGSRPACAEFDDCFDWQDAIIPLSAEGGARELISELAGQPERLAEISRRNAVQSLLRHDWSHRWQQILKTVGFEPTPELSERHDLLKSLSELPC